MIVYEIIYRRSYSINNGIHEILSTKRIPTDGNSLFEYLYDNNYIVDAGLKRMRDDNDMGYLYTQKIDMMTRRCIINLQNNVSIDEDFLALKYKVIPLIRDEIIDLFI